MPRSFCLLLAAPAFLLYGACQAQTVEQCLERCRSEQDARNMNCPAPDDYEKLPQRAVCMQKNQTVHDRCASACAPPAASPFPPSTLPQGPAPGTY